jgi:hypothetical protein
MNAHDLDVIIAEAQAEVDKMFAEFEAEWNAGRTPMEQQINGQETGQAGSGTQGGYA